MAEWKHLQITEETNPVSPCDGTSYVLYNPDLESDNVWFFLGLKWILEEGNWNNSLYWSNDGIWHFVTSKW